MKSNYSGPPSEEKKLPGVRYKETEARSESLDTKVWGAVEGVDDRGRVFGWVKTKCSQRKLSITVLKGRDVIGSGVPSVARPDIGGLNGFVIQCSSNVSAWDFTVKDAVCVAEDSAGNQTELATTTSLNAKAAALFIGGINHSALDQKSKETIRSVASHYDGEGMRAIKQVLEDLPERARPRRSASQLENLALAPGTMSLDGSAVIGLHNYAFLVGGTNNLVRQYFSQSSSRAEDDLATKWAELLRSRSAFCSDHEYNFLQLMIPEKTSILHHYFPREIPKATVVYAKLKELTKQDHRIRSTTLFADDYLGPSDFPKFDTHLTVGGAAGIARAVLCRLGIEWPFTELEFGEAKLIWGDLSHRFFHNGRIDEYYDMPSESFVSSLPSPILQSRIEVEGHIGTRRVWYTPDAPINMKVVVFGNSFFERGGTARGLSWWFARLFKYFSFHWSPEMIRSAVTDFSPDFVLCQSIERFLVRVPEK